MTSESKNRDWARILTDAHAAFFPFGPQPRERRGKEKRQNPEHGKKQQLAWLLDVSLPTISKALKGEVSEDLQPLLIALERATKHWPNTKELVRGPLSFAFFFMRQGAAHSLVKAVEGKPLQHPTDLPGLTFWKAEFMQNLHDEDWDQLARGVVVPVVRAWLKTIATAQKSGQVPRMKSAKIWFNDHYEDVGRYDLLFQIVLGGADLLMKPLRLVITGLLQNLPDTVWKQLGANRPTNRQIKKKIKDSWLFGKH